MLLLWDVSRIVKTPMDRVGPWKYRALLLGAITNGYHIVKAFSQKTRPTPLIGVGLYRYRLLSLQRHSPCEGPSDWCRRYIHRTCRPPDGATNPSAIWLRAELPVHKNKTRFFISWPFSWISFLRPRCLNALEAISTGVWRSQGQRSEQ